MSLTVIGIIGSAGHGKDAVCEIALSQNEDAKRIALADKLKEEVAAHFHEFPEFQLRFDRQGRISYVVPREEITPWKEAYRRKIYQLWGTEGRREIDSRWWLKEWAVKATAAVVAGFKTILVPDLRFRNEVDFVQNELGGVVYGVDRGAYRREDTDYNHASERFIPELLGRADLVIANQGDLTDLESAVMSALN